MKLSHFIWPAIVVVGILGAAWMFRYEIAGAATAVPVIAVLDRWTGTVRICGQSCYAPYR